jgi:5-hydroxyisourate hydrolase-like protein (transthyretin family)
MIKSRLFKPRLSACPFLFLAVVTLIQADSFALIVVGKGQIEDRGWPQGTLDLANHPSQIMWWVGPPFGGGRYCFLYRSKDTEEFNHLLTVFAKIRAPALELVVHDGPEYSHWVQRHVGSMDNGQIDLSFTVWVPENWHRLYNKPGSLPISDEPNFHKPLAPPRIDLYIGQGSIKWDEVNVPKNITVIDRRAVSAPVRPVGGGLVDANVYDIATGKPVSEAEISVMQFQPSRQWKAVATAKSDANGACIIARIPPGNYDIHVEAKGYAPRRAGRYRNRANTYRELNINLSKTKHIFGKVLDEDGNPVKDVKVQVMGLVGIDGFGYPPPDNLVTTTDAKGGFRFEGLPSGFTYLICRKEGLHQTNPRGLHIYEIPSKNPSEGIKIIMAPTGKIHGKIIGAEKGTSRKGDEQKRGRAEKGTSRKGDEQKRGRESVFAEVPPTSGYNYPNFVTYKVP